MKILTLVHEGGTGGSQRNAVDLSVELARRGHQVTVASPEPMGVPDPLQERVIGYGRGRPAPARIARVQALLRDLRPDVIHAYEWPPILEAFYALGPRATTGLLGTVMSMSVDREVPRTVSMLVGTPRMRDLWREHWRAPVDVCLPPVDLRSDRFDALARARFRVAHEIERDEFLVVAVSRVSRVMKLSSLVLAMRAIAQCGTNVRLVIVGNGDAMPQVRATARAINQMCGRQQILLPGALTDARSAYSAADLVLGMGGSALRAMAHRRPVIVTGEEGFWRTVDHESIVEFGRYGFFGVGTNGEDPAESLADCIAALRRDASQREYLGRFGRAYVSALHDVSSVAEQVECALLQSAQRNGDWAWGEALRAARAALGRELRLKARRPSVVVYDDVWNVRRNLEECAA